MSTVRVLTAVSVIAVLASACSASDAVSRPVQRLRVDIVGTVTHDSTAFTEGLELADGKLYEGTGTVGQSRLTVSDPVTGAIDRRVDLSAPLFGEGITLVGTALWQLTWRDHVAIRRDRTTLAEIARVPFDGEGWGLCARKGRIVMSNGTDTLTYRNPETFAPEGSVRIVGMPDIQLNELDCAADGRIYANAYPTDTILRIDPERGRVTGAIDATCLLARAGVSAAQQRKTQVLNGIAQIPGTDRFLVTGKYWPVLLDVKFVE